MRARPPEPRRRRALHDRVVESGWRSPEPVRGAVTAIVSPRLRAGLVGDSSRGCAVSSLSIGCRCLRCSHPADPWLRAAGGGWRCPPCARRPVLPRSSTRAPSPSGGRLFHPYWQSRAVWRGPLKQIRDLPWPPLSSSPRLVNLSWLALPAAKNVRRAQVVQRRCHAARSSFAGSA